MENKGTLEVLWPGGVRNKLYKVRASSTIVFPEIPCSYDDMTMGHEEYEECVEDALEELTDMGKLTHKQEKLFFKSAIKAYREHHRSDKRHHDDHDDHDDHDEHDQGGEDR